MRVDLSKDWQRMIGGELDQPYFRKLAEVADEERRLYQVYPPELDVFTALTLTLYGSVHGLLLGQDPYHEEGQAHGLCFSVRPVVKLPPSLQNIFIELPHDPGCAISNNGYLVPWAMQGILLLNAVLTVRAHAPDSHRGKGWEHFTDAIIRRVDEKDGAVVFVLWGSSAQKKAELIDTARHAVVRAAHPSPLSARNGFLGSRPFSATNSAAGRSQRPMRRCGHQVSPRSTGRFRTCECTPRASHQLPAIAHTSAVSPWGSGNAAA